MSDVYEITYSSFELKTVGDFIFAAGSPASHYKNKEEEFLSVVNKSGKTNRETIISKFKSKKKLEDIKTLSAKDLPIKVGTVLAIPVSKIDRVGLLTDGIQIVENNVAAFKARQLVELEENENYNPVRKLQNGKLLSGGLSETYPEITVWIWCKALSNSKLSSDADLNKGEIFNITPFIQKLTTNNSKGGGNFSFTLPPLSCEFDSDREKWVVKKASYSSYKRDSKNNTQQGDGYVAESHIVYEQDSLLRRSQFLFHNIISSNDVVFIRFETLNLEKDQRIADNDDFIIHKSQLPGRIYDMIGLVDSNQQNVDGTHGDVNITIQGRDLSKLFIDDGTYFYALEMSQGQLNFAGGSVQENEYMQRVFMDGSLQYFNLYFNNSIENVFKFVLQQLSSIKIVSDDLFEYYGERRNTRWINLETKKERDIEINKKLKQYKEQGIQSIEKMRDDRKINLSSDLLEKEKVEEIWRKCLHFFKAERDRKRESNQEKYFYVFSRGVEELRSGEAPLFMQEDLKSARIDQLDREFLSSMENYITIDKTHPDFDESTSIGPAKGIWQIVKLVIDDAVTERRLVDSSASSANGSLINFLRKVCQEPFVEFYTDTYGDMFHLIVRKPPIDYKGIISMLEGDVRVENQDEEKRYRSTVIDIEIEDVLQEQLAYSEKDVYSWYHLNPQSNFLGKSNTYSLAYLPAIFFKEYADIWGSRPLNITHNYMPKLPLNSQQSILDITERQAFNDLAYLVESHVYMPFVRQGTIVLNGDRRLKIGNICRYKPTGEIFFIDGVQQNFSVNDNYIDRTTTIEVSRGMVESLIKKVNLPNKIIRESKEQTEKDFGYFCLLKDTKLNIQEETVTETIKERVRVSSRKVKKYKAIDERSGLSYDISQTKDAANSIRRTLKSLGYSEKKRQLDDAGFVTIRMAEIANSIFATIKQRFPSYKIVVTAGNDKYHAKRNSKHNRGAALDFVVLEANRRMLDNVVGILEEYKSRFSDFGYIDEYKSPSAHSTGGHFHIDVKIGVVRKMRDEEKKQAPVLESTSSDSFWESLKRQGVKAKQAVFGNKEARNKFKEKIGIAESGGSMRNSKGEIIRNKNKGQTAQGKYQIIESTWKNKAKVFYRKYGRIPQREDLKDNEIIMDLLLDDYEDVLKRQGLELSGTHFYALHLKGKVRWIKNAYKNPNASVSTEFTQSEISLNKPYMKGGTLGSVLNALAEKMSENKPFKNKDLVDRGQGFLSREQVVEEYVDEDVYEDRERKVTRVILKRELVFENFIIDKANFNFFLKRMQNDPKMLNRSSRLEVTHIESKN